ncbi:MULTISPECIES: tripartite tricarboxylate transporter TctB family protein [Roseateles]|uniref:Tripartite tricarboxylate transporter TctB family protein n=1 Tax=Roseateles albus TaxID=2987525 RepID=A0ABT5KA14_9BURK|nr:tripartite tricarboxylate transporter TctB family protein [Paucibacter sp. TC2R-5]MCV2357734.1 tripartite tricarboxylate transporter TctB family protein [Paucibacter sp. TC2R-5]MDC8770780.1 tripartite tricarboxylate transporter TctB family protein [Roseateles albus]
MSASSGTASVGQQTWVGVGALLIGVLMAYGASFISSDAGYAGIGPNALPWFVAVVLMLCGGWLIWEARSGGYREMEAPSGAEQGDWRAAAFVIGGVVANAALITVIGFILACSLCFALAVRGLRMSEGKPGGGPRQCLLDGLTGLIIAAPVFWLFTKVLAINLPGLTASGWL